MPIKGLTNGEMDFPEIGRLRKGAPKTQADRPGKDLTYFRFEADELARLVDIVEPILNEVGTPTHKSDFYSIR